MYRYNDFTVIKWTSNEHAQYSKNIKKGHKDHFISDKKFQPANENNLLDQKVSYIKFTSFGYNWFVLYNAEQWDQNIFSIYLNKIF